MPFEIGTFSGSEKDSCRIYRQEWRIALINQLRITCSDIHAEGLLGFALSATEYSKFENPSTFVPKVRPGNNFAMQGLEASEYRSQQGALMDAKAAIHAALGRQAKECIADNGILPNDLRTIIERLDQHYFIVTQEELSSVERELSQPYSTTKDFRSLLADHRRAHKVFADVNQPMREGEKLRYLVNAISHIADLSTLVTSFYQNYPNVADQRFDTLAATVTSYMSNRPTAVQSNAYANAATVDSMNKLNKLVSDLTERVEALQKELVAEKRKSRSGGKRSARKEGYCWTHGRCGHSSSECFTKAEGHQNDATLENKKGGK